MRKSAIGALTILVLLAMAALRTVDLWRWRTQTLESAQARADNLALILSSYVGETFAAGDASLRQLALHSVRIGGPAAAARDWTPSLASARAGLTGVGSISVTDRDGIIRHSTQPLIVGQSRSNQYLFRRLASDPSDVLAIDTPFLSQREPRQFLIPIGRRLTNADGGFEGAIVATFSAAVPRGFFRTIDVGERGIVWVFHPDGVVLFREPSGADPIGRPAQNNPIFARAAQGATAGALQGPVEAGGPVLVSAFHTSTRPPLIVAVSLDRDEVLAAWRDEATGAIATFTVLALTVFATLLVLYRQMDAKAGAQAALRRTQQAEATRLRQANEQLEAALEREQSARRDAEAANALKDQFLMTVSHELRTPLTAIYGWARMLVDGAVRAEQRASALRTIERNARAQMRLVDDLLDVSRVMGGKLRLDIRLVRIGDIVQNAVETMRPAVDAKMLQLHVALDPAAAFVAGDPERLQQIVWNLLSNAVKFTPSGGRVTITTARTDSRIDLAVADTGAGISPDFLPYVFERFRQEDAGSKRRYGGLGLGLAIVRSLVELHGGSVRAQSDGEGRGATFTVTLPAATGAGAPAAGPAYAAAVSADGERHDAARDRLDGVRVLVVDDEPEARELFARILEVAGAEVTCAASAADALAALREAPQDVLLSDIEMPGIDGYTLLPQAAALAAARGERLSAVAVTAYSRPEDEARSLAAGFDRHVRKPVDPIELIEAVRLASMTV